MTSNNNKREVRLALLLGLFSALGPFTIDMYLPAFPEMAEEFNTTPSLIQFSLTACLLGLGVGQLVTGALSDGYGRRNPAADGSNVQTIFEANEKYNQPIPKTFKIKQTKV